MTCLTLRLSEAAIWASTPGWSASTTSRDTAAMLSVTSGTAISRPWRSSDVKQPSGEVAALEERALLLVEGAAGGLEAFVRDGRGRDDDEVVAADVAEVALGRELRRARREHAREAADHLVAADEAVAIVVLLEAVEVGVEHARRRLVHGGEDPALDAAVAGQARERVRALRRLHLERRRADHELADRHRAR